MILLQAVIQIFGIKFSLAIILYIFIALGGITLIIYLLNLLFGKNKFKSTKIQDHEILKSQILEKNKESLDKEIVSIVKNRKEPRK